VLHEPPFGRSLFAVHVPPEPSHSADSLLAPTAVAIANGAAIPIISARLASSVVIFFILNIC